MTFSPFDAAAILIVLAAVLGYINHRLLHWPQTIGLTVMGALTSLIVIAADRLLPDSNTAGTIVRFLHDIDFRATVLDGLLSFLLFAAALHVDWPDLRAVARPVAILATMGVVLSAVLAAWLAALAVGCIWAGRQLRAVTVTPSGASSGTIPTS